MIDLEVFDNDATTDAAIYDAKELFGRHRPYSTQDTIVEGVYKYLFNPHFTTEMIDFFSTQCVTAFSTEELAFLRVFIEWQEFLIADPQNIIIAGSVEDTFAADDKAALLALNDWLVDELAGVPHPVTC